MQNINEVHTSSNHIVIVNNNNNNKQFYQIIPEIIPDEFVAREKESIRSKSFQDKIKQKFAIFNLNAAKSKDQLIEKVKTYACEQHAGQMRKGVEHSSQYQHCLNVAKILEENGFDNETIAAGLLHDTLEDTSTTVKQLKNRFGSRIADMVENLSEKGSKTSWSESRDFYVSNIKKSNPKVKAISAADKINNMESMTKSLNVGYDIFKDMTGSFDEHVKKFKTIYRVVSGDIPEGIKTRYIKALKGLIRAGTKI